MIRTSVHSISETNVNKLLTYNEFRNEYRRVAKIYLNYLWKYGWTWKTKDGEDLIFNISENKLNHPQFIDSSIHEKVNLYTNLSGRALKCCLTQVCGIIGASTEKQRKRLYILNKLTKENKKIHPNFLKKIKENIPTKPNIDKINPELNSICAEFEETDGHFDGFLELASLGKEYGKIRIPIKYTSLSNKFKKQGIPKKSFLFKRDSIDIRWEIPTPKKLNKGKTIGVDQGALDLLTFSNKQVTPKTCTHGHSLASIMLALTLKRKGSRSFHRSQDHRTNFINWSINQLNLSGIRKLKLEKINNIGYKNKRSRWLSHWAHRLIEDKVSSLCEENGVRLVLQSNTYRSQRCHKCGLVRKSNRTGKIYKCKACENTCDADYNSSKNHEVNLPDVPSWLRKSKLNRKGFYWLRAGFYDLDNKEITVPCFKDKLSTSVVDNKSN